LQSILLSKLEQIDGMQKVQQFLSGDRMFWGRWPQAMLPVCSPFVR
jgi:hypothetical protein